MTTINRKYKKTFFEVLQDYKAEQFLKIRKPNQLKSKSNIEQSTYNTYLKREKKIIEYFVQINKLKILCMDVDSRFLELFDNWLTQNGCGQLYATKCIKLVKTVMVYAKNSKLIKINFADSYKNKTVPKKKVKTLKKADYDKLLEVQALLTETERKYVDVMIFMRETLLHVGDYRQLTSDNIKVYDNGSVWLIKPRMKRQEENNQIQIIPLSEIAIEIISKYNGIENMPKTVDTCINKYIKMACHKAGIEMSVSTKLGRSSGISHKYNVLKMRERSIAVAAGWTSTAHLVDYLEVDMEAFRNEFLGEEA